MNENVKNQMSITSWKQYTIWIRYIQENYWTKIVDDTFYTQEKLVNKQTENNELALKETEFKILKL
jgi:hypothetical protein